MTISFGKSDNNFDLFELLEQHPKLAEFIEHLFTSNNCYKRTSNAIITRCPHCGDSQKRLVGHGHLYVYRNGYAVCHRCGEYRVNWRRAVVDIARKLRVGIPAEIQPILENSSQVRIANSASILSKPNIQKLTQPDTIELLNAFSAYRDLVLSVYDRYREQQIQQILDIASLLSNTQNPSASIAEDNRIRLVLWKLGYLVKRFQLYELKNQLWLHIVVLLIMFNVILDPQRFFEQLESYSKTYSSDNPTVRLIVNQLIRKYYSAKREWFDRCRPICFLNHSYTGLQCRATIDNDKLCEQPKYLSILPTISNLIAELGIERSSQSWSADRSLSNLTDSIFVRGFVYELSELTRITQQISSTFSAQSDFASILTTIPISEQLSDLYSLLNSIKQCKRTMRSRDSIPVYLAEGIFDIQLPIFGKILKQIVSQQVASHSISCEFYIAVTGKSNFVRWLILLIELAKLIDSERPFDVFEFHILSDRDVTISDWKRIVYTASRTLQLREPLTSYLSSQILIHYPPYQHKDFGETLDSLEQSIVARLS